MSAGRLCVVGSANVDTVVRIAALPAPGETVLGEVLGSNPGGKGLNQAVAAARVGANVAMCATLGDDSNGALLRSVMQTESINTDAVQNDHSTPTGMAQVYALPGGENSIVVAAGSNMSMTAARAEAAVEGATVVLAQCEVPVVAVKAALESAQRVGAHTVLNAAPVVPGTDTLLPFVDTLIVNETEAADLGGLETIVAAGPRTVVMTRGAAGAVVVTGGRTTEVPAVTVAAVDTTGAGDAFCGVYAAALLTGLSEVDAARRASAAGALATVSVGAQGAALSDSAVTQAVERGVVQA